MLTPSVDDLYIKGGFKPGWIYELIYETEGSRVMGLGFLGIRDLLSMVRYATHDSAGNPNPLAGYVDKLYGTGQSMSGRVIREYVYEGWNVDGEGRKLFDAVHTHTGSGRLFHNTRFAQVGRYPRQHEEHQWPAEYYPFTFDAVPDPFTERRDGLWKRPETDPLVIHTHTEGDYWIRHVSLTHTDPRDASDVALPENDAHVPSHRRAAHGARRCIDPIWIGQLTVNDMSAAPYRRAALVAAGRVGDQRHAATPDATPAHRRMARSSPPTRCSPATRGIPGVNLPTRAPAASRATTTAPTSTSAAS